MLTTSDEFDLNLIRSLERNPAFQELRRYFDSLGEDFYGHLARKLYANPEAITSESLLAEKRFWNGVKTVLAFPSQQASTRPRGDEV